MSINKYNKEQQVIEKVNAIADNMTIKNNNTRLWLRIAGMIQHTSKDLKRQILKRAILHGLDYKAIDKFKDYCNFKNIQKKKKHTQSVINKCKKEGKQLCPNCNSFNNTSIEVPTKTGGIMYKLECIDCNAYIKWVNKETYMLFK